MHRKRIRYLGLLMLVFFSEAFAQQPAYIQFTIDQGLPSNEVYSTYSDNQGLLWFATDFGIAQYDGYQFHLFTTNEGLTSNTVFDFSPTEGGDFWLRTFNNKLCYKRGDKFYAYGRNSTITKFLRSGELIQKFVVDRDSNLWFSINRAGSNLMKMNFQSGAVDTIFPSNDNNATIHFFPDGKLIAAVNTRISSSSKKVSAGTDRWDFSFPVDDTAGLHHPIAMRLSNGHIIVSYNSTICIYDRSKMIRHEKVDGLISSVYEDSSHRIWLATTSGITVLENETSRPEIFMSGSVFFSVNQDFEGGYWITTAINGVYYFPNISIQTMLNKGGAKENDIVSVEIRKQILLFHDRITLYRYKISNDQPDTSSRIAYSANSSYLHDFGWYGRSEKSMVYLGGRNVQLPDTPDKQFHALENVIGGARMCHTDTDGSILFASTQGVAIADSSGKISYRSSDENFNKSCTSFIRDFQNKYWIGTVEGLYRKENKSFHFMGDDFPEFKERVTDLALFGNDILIVSTRSKGLFLLKKNKLQHIGQKNGLSSDLCGRVYVDGNTIWVATNSGLNKIECKNSGDTLACQISILDIQQGLPSNRVNDISSNGDLVVVATGNGIAWFSKSKYRHNQIPPRIFIKSLSAGNRKISLNNPELKAEDVNLVVDFLGLSFRGRGQLKYRYMLKGYDTTWHFTSSLSASFLNLPAGDYTFIVMAQNENGVWSNTPATLSFHLPEHYSKTWWFRSLLVISILIVIIGAITYYFDTRRRKTEYEKALHLAELKALRAQMKPHFLFNSINAIQHFILTHNEESAHLYLGQFAKLMRLILEQSKRASITIHEEIETLKIYLDLERLRFVKSLELQIEIAPEVSQNQIRIPPLLLQPFVENAIWHGLLPSEKNPRLLLRFAMHEKGLRIIIEDNGIGRKRAAELRRQAHASTGMRNVEERIHLLNYNRKNKIVLEITDLKEHDEPAGTRITIYIPSQQADQNETEY